MRIAVLSPAVNRRRGTERAVAELVERLAQKYRAEVHLYAQEVEDLETKTYSHAASRQPGDVLWHRIGQIPGPHLIQFIYWILANRAARLWNKWRHGLAFDVVFSPGINALDADVILVHAVFHRLRELQGSRGVGGLRGWHRALYYRLLCWLELRVYWRKSLRLAAVSRRTSDQLTQYFDRADVTVIPNGVDAERFSPANRAALRVEARRKLGYTNADIVVLLVGNDFRNKGLQALLEAVSLLQDPRLRVCVVGNDASWSGQESAVPTQLQERVTFAGETTDILPFYAAADVYTAPSLEDSFNLPALEAMACGLPVVVSTRAGISEYLRDGEDGLLLRNPKDARELADALQRVVDAPGVAAQLGERARMVANTFSWDRHVASVYGCLESASKSTDRQL